MLPDIRVSCRQLWKAKAFTLTVAATLALCIGANTALFSVVHNVLLRPLPFPDSERILVMSNAYPGAGYDIGRNSSAPDYFDRLRETTAFEEQAMYNSGDVTVDQNGTPVRLRVMNVTPSFFRLLQVPPLLGRTFTEAEGEIGNEQKIVLSYALWQTQFGGDPAAPGRDLRIDGRPYTVVGIMPRPFAFVNDAVMLWRPIAFTSQQKSDQARHGNNWRNIGRLKPGVTVAQAQAQIDALNAANLDRFPQYKQLLINARFHTVVTPLQDDLVRGVKGTLYLMWAGALFVLLIGCVNVANLVLVRSRARLKELATRLALGASWLRIAHQLIAESVLLSMISAVGGLVVGAALLRGLDALSIHDLPRGSEIHLDPVVIVGALATAAVVGVVLGLIPVAYAMPANLTEVLREEGRGGTAAHGARALRRALVVVQIAFAFILLVGAGLLFASFRRVLALDPGFKAPGVLTASISLPATRYKDATAQVAFVAEALRRLRAVPGVNAAGATNTIPFGSNHNDSVILAEGHQMKPGESVISPNHVTVSTGYFEAMTAKLVRGRFFDERDAAGAPKVAIVDQNLAHRFWPDQDPIGRRLYLPTDLNNLIAITEKTEFFTVVGIVGDLTLDDLARDRSSMGAYYFPIPQDPTRLVTFALRTSSYPAGLAASLRETIATLDRELPLFDVQTMEERTDGSLMARRSPMVLSLGFGAVALFLSAIGIYGVLAYLVTQRTKEIGIRIALGGSARSIFELVLREGALLIGCGLFLGGAGALAVRRTLENQLYGITATDPGVLGTVVLLLAVVAIAACVLPARRATKINPIVALAG